MASGCASPTPNMESRRGRRPSCMTARACLAAAGSPKLFQPSRRWMPPPPHSAGILLFRQREGAMQVLLIKPGGPFWKNKDAGAWMIPKGMVESGEAPAEAALREFEEETGTKLNAALIPLATVRQAGGKRVEAFVVEGELDPAAIHSNEF